MTMVTLVGNNIDEEAKLNFTIELINLLNKYNVNEKLYVFKKIPIEIIHKELQVFEEVEDYLTCLENRE